jgi:tRNA C32,U32 (ribose-2'-O)-methylase TrmJ
MLHLLPRADRPFRIGPALAIAAIAGWSGFIYSVLSSGQQVKALTAERDAALASHQQLQEAAGKLSDIEAKLGTARVEYGRVVQGWAEARGRLGAAQQELAVLTKRLDQAKDRVSQTGSIRSEPPKAPARKP